MVPMFAASCCRLAQFVVCWLTLGGLAARAQLIPPAEPEPQLPVVKPETPELACLGRIACALETIAGYNRQVQH